MAKKIIAKPVAKKKAVAPTPKKVAKEVKKVVSTKPKPVDKKVAVPEKKIVEKPIKEKKVIATPAPVEAKTEALVTPITAPKKEVLTTPKPKLQSKHIHGKQTYGDKTIHVYFITAVKKRPDGGALLTPETGEKDLAVSSRFVKELQPKPNNYFIIGAGGTMSYLTPDEFESTYVNPT
jgi:hypothetical protein